jgi:hypothetical protein
LIIFHAVDVVAPVLQGKQRPPSWGVGIHEKEEEEENGEMIAQFLVLP